MIKISPWLQKISHGLDLLGAYSQADQLDELLTKLAKKELYDLPIVCTVAIFRKTESGLEVLLEVRKKSPDKGTHCLVGGHVEEIRGKQEDYKVCAVRETKEETNIDLNPDELIYVCERVRDAKKRKRDVLFTCMLPMDRSEAKAGSDAGGVEWTPIDQIPSLAWDHELFLEEALKKVLTKPAPTSINISNLHLPYRTNLGCLIVIEGCDCAGKSSQVEALVGSLDKLGYRVKQTKWASSEALKKTLKEYKKKTDMPEMLYSLLNAADMQDRYFFHILSWLSQGKVVVCDRYIYSSIVRDMVRGVDPTLLKIAYQNFLKPDLVLYCSVPATVAVRRLKREDRAGYYGAGLDLHLKSDPWANFKQYTEKCQALYDQIFKQVDTSVKVNTNRDVDEVAEEILEKAIEVLEARGIESKHS